MDKIWLFKLERGKVMKYKKLKRALALTVAVLMAVPTVNYGGMTEVHAEGGLTDSSGNSVTVTGFEQPSYWTKTYLAGTDKDYIKSWLPTGVMASYEVINDTVSESLEETTDAVQAVETIEQQEITDTKTEDQEEELQPEKTEGKQEESQPEETEGKQEELQPEETEGKQEELQPEETEGKQEESQPEETEEKQEESQAEQTEEPIEEQLTVSSVMNAFKNAFQPMVVHAEGAYKSWMNVDIKGWNEVSSTINADGTGTIKYQPIIDNVPSEIERPVYTVNLVKDGLEILTLFDNFEASFDDMLDEVYIGSPTGQQISYNSSEMKLLLDGEPIESKYGCAKTGNATITASYYGKTAISKNIYLIHTADCYTVNTNDEWTNQKVVVTAKDGYEFLEEVVDENTGMPDTVISAKKEADVKDGTWGTGEISFSVGDKKYKAMSYDVDIAWKIDKAIPTGIITVGGTTWNQAFSGSYPNRQGMQVDGSATATLTAADEGSGVAAIQYQVFNNYPASDASAIEQAASANGGWKTYTGAIPMNASGNTIICAKITDKAGNVRYIASGRMYTGATDPGTTDASTPGTTEPATPSNPETTTPGTTDNGTVTPSQPELNVSVSGIKAQTYTGKAITPKIVVKDNATKKKLKQGKQYTVSYENNVNAGTGTIVLTGINGYEGVKRVDFTIQPQNIAKKIKAKVNGKKFRYAGTALTPGVTVTYGKMVLAEGADYEISYADNNSKGTAKIYLKGNGNYTGTRTVKFKITGPQMKEAEVTLSASSAVYGSADSRPGVTAVYNGKTLTEGTDYTVKYPKTWKPGKNMITIQGKGNFSGSVKRAFTIEKAPMDKVTVSAKSTWQATGKKLNIVPDSVTLNGAALVPNKDYTVKYRSTSTGKAVSAVKTTGAYQMVLTGKGCYQGTKTVDFTVTDGTAVDNTNPSAPATTPETKPEAKPETKPETTVTGVGAVVDGLQLVESDIEGTFSTGDHIGQKVKLTATLSELENREESLKAFEHEVPWMMDVEECTDTDLSHYDIHCVATNIEGITDATQFTLKLKIDGVTKDSVVYGLNKYNNDDYDGLLGITCYDGYVAVRSSYKHFFNPKEIYIMVKK